jgi:hypothetical protein
MDPSVRRRAIKWPGSAIPIQFVLWCWAQLHRMGIRVLPSYLSKPEDDAMPEKLAKIAFLPSTANRNRVGVKPKRPSWDGLRAWPDRDLRSRLAVSLPTLLVLLVARFLLISRSRAPLYSSACSGVQPGMVPDQGCTIFYAADDSVALGGNNEDYDNPYTVVWFVPPTPGTYGRVYFGYEDGFPQGGVNEKGLFFDGAALPYKALSGPNDKPVYEGVIPRGNLFDKIMSESATVSEALTILDAYSHYGMDTYQILIGDASGDSAIVDGDTILRKRGPFQVATNYRLSENPDPPYPCWRYNTALDLLSKADVFSVELFRDILNATHQERPYPTLYSNVYDLKNGLIYLYYHHDFNHVVVIDVAVELAKGFHFYPLASLFPSNAEDEGLQAQRASAYETQIARRATPTGQGPYSSYAGDYRVGQMGETVSVYVDAERLYVWQHSSLPIELLSEAEGRFFHVFHDGNDMTIDFERDVQGAVIGATGVLYGEAFHLERLETVQPTAQPTPVLDDAAGSISPTAAPVPVVGDAVRAIPWWGWAVAALGAIAIAAVVRWTIKR